MKKSLLALAVLGAFAGVASAQSSVTLFGTVDLTGRYVKNDGRRPSPVAGHGRHQQQPARLPRHRRSRRRPARRGFNLLRRRQRRHRHRRTRKFWNRRSTVSLFSNAGELRLGRDYTPTFWNHDDLRCVRHERPRQLAQRPRRSTAARRQDNSIGYFLPANLGGFYGQVMVAAGEGGTLG